MQNKQKLLSPLLLMSCSAISTQSLATMPSDAVLKFEPGVRDCIIGGIFPDCLHNVAGVVSGSFFGMDTDGNGTIIANEKIPLVVNAGITLGKTQSASGSHSGAPNGSETAGIDQPWSFFGNTGLNFTTVAPVISTDDGAGNVTLDVSGWTVTWNAIPVIPLGSDPWNGNPEGTALVTCASDCADGDTYVLNYSATVPAGDPSGFGGVLYQLYYEGTVTLPPLAAVDSGVIGSGAIAQSVGAADGRISLSDTGVEDPSFTYGAGLLDFVVTGITPPTVSIVIPQTAPIPASSVYRKLIGGVWTTFMADGSNLVASAADVAGVCPATNDPAYGHANGLVEGDTCVQLVILDGGVYDADATATNIADPGGVATPVQMQVDTRTSGTDGCSISGNSSKAQDHADWWIVAAFISLLGWFNIRRERSAKNT